MTPLHWSVERGHADCAEVLVRYGADVNFENKFGKCPLELASEHGRSDMYEMLQVILTNFRLCVNDKLTSRTFSECRGDSSVNARCATS